MKKEFLKKFTEHNTTMEVLKALGEAKKSMTLLELRKIVEGADVNRRVMRELEREELIEKIPHYLKNSIKKFMHPETKKVEFFKGTKVYSYKVIENN